jgi:CRISPR-associated exonuclease Cas4
MISASSMSDFLYCPLKAYLKYAQGYEVSSEPLLIGKLTHELLRGFNEIKKRNLWSLEKNMTLDEISRSLWEDVPSLIKKTISKKDYKDIVDKERIEEICEILEDQFTLDSFLMVFKSRKMLNIGISGDEMADILFPPSMVEFRMESRSLGLRGKVDRIEIEEGIYFPVEIKTGVPPIKGVWKSHALQLTAYAILMEETFQREVMVGFVDYVQVGERKPVIIGPKLREEFYNTFHELESMILEGYVPEATPSSRKCNKCEFNEFCEYGEG